MIGHYLSAALSNAARAPFTTAAKIVTLALGLLAMICVVGVVSYWRAGDSAIASVNRAIVFTTEGKSKDFNIGEHVGSTGFLAKYVRMDIPELKTVARFRPLGDVAADTGERTVILEGANADPQFLDIFHFTFVAGDPKTAMRQEDGVVLTQATAERLFGQAPALGRSLVLGGQRKVVVTGVIGPVPEPSEFSAGDRKFDYFSVMRPDPPAPEHWGSQTGTTYALLPADGSLTIDQLKVRLKALLKRRRAPTDTIPDITLGAVHVNQVTELAMNGALFGIRGGAISVVTIFYGLGLLVLTVACLNYANLATAQTIARAKEIGMRRVLGAGPMGILLQSWTEAGLATLAALTFTGFGLWLATPVIAKQAGIDVIGALAHDPAALAQIAAIAIGVTLLAGLYPAVLVSRMRPVEALRSGKVRGGPRGIAQLLVGLQFASASALVIALIVVGDQNALMRRLAFSHAADPVVFLPPQTKSGIAIDTLRQQLAGYPQIKAIGESIRQPWTDRWSVTRMARSPEAMQASANVLQIGVGFGYFDANAQKVLAGRVFTRDRDYVPRPPVLPPGFPAPAPPGATSLAVVDRSFIEKAGFASPQAAVGQTLYRAANAVYQIIGVVEDRPQTIQSTGSVGTFFNLDADDPANMPMVRISAQDVDGGIAAIKRVWAQLAPDRPLDFQFEDQLFEENFRAFERVGVLFLALSLVALVISSMGLFGMAVHATQRRKQEIGVRKTLGSSTRAVVGLLLADFSRPVVIANLIAWPLAYLAAKAYLATFTNRIDLTVWPFALSLVITLAIAWLAVGGQTLRAASVRPAQVLRDA